MYPPIWKLHNPNCHNVLLWTWPLCAAKSLFNSPTCFLKSPFSIQGIPGDVKKRRDDRILTPFWRSLKTLGHKRDNVPQGSYALKVASKNLKRGTLICPKYFPVYFFHFFYIHIVREQQCKKSELRSSIPSTLAWLKNFPLTPWSAHKDQNWKFMLEIGLRNPLLYLL